MSSCTECHGTSGLHISSDCPRITGAKLYTPAELENLIQKRIKAAIPEKLDNYNGTDMEDGQNGYNAAISDMIKRAKGEA